MHRFKTALASAIRRAWNALTAGGDPASVLFHRIEYLVKRFPKMSSLATWRVWVPAMAGGDPTSVLDDKVKEIGKQVEAKRKEAQDKWAAFEAKRDELAESDTDITDEESEGFQQAEAAHLEYATAADELSALEGRRERLWSMTAERNGGDSPLTEAREHIRDGLVSRETPGARVVASEAYQRLRDSGAFTSSGRLGNIQLGEMMSRDELYAALVVTDEEGDSTVRPFIEPLHRGFVEPRFRPLLVTDLITVLQTDSDSIDYVVETGWTNNAAGVPEATTEEPIGGAVTAELGGVKPQSSLTYEKRDEAVKTLAHWIAATKKSLADVARLRTLIETRLRRGLADVVEDQVIAGDGTDENLLGVVNTTGVQHQERGAGPLVDDIHRAITKVRLAFFEPTATGLHPLDWEEIRLSRDDSGAAAGTGGYLFGPPSQAGATTLWGLPPVIGPQFPQEQPIVADWSVIELYIREGASVIASDSHADFFVRNLVAILAEMRVGQVIPQPEGICEVSEGSS